MKIVVLDGLLPNPGDISWDPISQFGEFEVYDFTPPEQIAQRIKGAEAIFTNRCNITRELIQGCPTLRYIGTFGTGYNNIDIAAAKECGVKVYNIPAYCRYAVAQMAVALLLEIACRTSVFDHYIKAGKWKKDADPEITSVRQMELSGKTLGIIGMGNIGHTVAQTGIALGMKVLAYKRTPDKSLENEHLRFCSLEELLRESDVISIHCPLNDGTRGLINRNTIAMMKEGAIIINTGRGAVVEEDAVVEALDSGKLYAYGSDVFCRRTDRREKPFSSSSALRINAARRLGGKGNPRASDFNQRSEPAELSQWKRCQLR